MKTLEALKDDTFFVVAHDAESYQTAECFGSTLVEAWERLMYFDGNPPIEETTEFEAFANDPDNWGGAEGLCYLIWEVGGEGNGKIEFYRSIHSRSQLFALAHQINDATAYETPKTDRVDEILKCQPAHGMRIGWYFKEDAEFYKAEKINPRQYTQYSGLLILRPDAENRGPGPHEIEDLVLVVDSDPCEKRNPEVNYIAFATFLDSPDLVEVFEQRATRISK